jgi:glucose/arabinose dehydrogenase
MLYVGLGDGGGLGDPRENAQDPGTLLGKVVRISPTPAGPRPYVVPRDNPFVGRPGWRSEIWALGVRNPFRMSLDTATGDLWLGDVGQTCWEELNRLPTAAAGANLGWDRREGPSDFEGGDLIGDEVMPVHAYPHAEGWCAIVAGYVPRGSAIPELDGWLLHTDYCRGRLLAVRVGEGDVEPVEVRELGLRLESPTAIVPGPTGRPWVLTLDGPVFELRR